jgi:putative restriction endonuclease
MRFRAIPADAPFLFKLKNPINKIAGVGFFSSDSLLPIDFAWEVFQERNGTSTFEDLYQKIDHYRSEGNKLRNHPIIGCIVITNPVFFNEIDWITAPSDWAPNIVQGKKYSSETQIGRAIWDQVGMLLKAYSNQRNPADINSLFNLEDPDLRRYGSDVLIKPRLGQGAFRVLVTDTYSRRCAVSGEKTLPVLEAAHIRPYEKQGPHKVSNGLLLRSDIHKLFDKGYLTISADYRIEVSSRIKEQFENGRDYYKYHGKELVTVPILLDQRPGEEFISWHNENIYQG